jgi:hypothetical protein
MLRVEPRSSGATADEFAKALAAEKLPAAAHYIQRPIYQYPLFTDHSAFDARRSPVQADRLQIGQVPVAEEILALASSFRSTKATPIRTWKRR